MGSRHGYPSHHLQFAPASPGARRLLLPSHRNAPALLGFGSEVFRPKDLANFGLALPAGPVSLVKFHEARRPFNRFFLRLQLKDRIPADDFLGLGERPVDRDDLPSRKADARARRRRRKPAAVAYRASFDRLFTQLRHRIYKFLGWSAFVLSRLDQHHESHRDISSQFGVGNQFSGLSTA